MENTISVKEFKAWLEGFEESFSSYQPYPNKEQWEKIYNKISTIDDYSLVQKVNLHPECKRNDAAGIPATNPGYI